MTAAGRWPPGPLEGVADEITVQYPWGSLLRAVIGPDPAILERIARVGRRGARLHVRLNLSALGPALAGASTSGVTPRLRAGYGTAGIRLESCAVVVLSEAETSWGARLHQGRPAAVFAIDGTVV